MVNAEETEHTEMCERIHVLLAQAAELDAYPIQVRLVGAPQEAEDVAHEMCTGV